MKLRCVARFLALLLLSTSVSPAQQAGDRELEDAKTLYRDGRFTEAAARLEAVCLRLGRTGTLHQHELIDAYLHLGLSYVAVNDRLLAKAAFRELARLDRTRRLDPDVYAPKVVELFEEARQEALREAPAPAPAPAPSPAAQSTKKGLKLPLILIGAGGAAGVAVALAAGGGGQKPATPPGTALSPSPTPSPVPTPCPPPFPPNWITPTRGATLTGTVVLQCTPPPQQLPECFSRMTYGEAEPGASQFNTIGQTSTPPYAVSWNSFNLPNGSRDLLCIIYPPSGNGSGMRINVTLSNPGR